MEAERDARGLLAALHTDPDLCFVRTGSMPCELCRDDVDCDDRLGIEDGRATDFDCVAVPARRAAMDKNI